MREREGRRKRERIGGLNLLSQQLLWSAHNQQTQSPQSGMRFWLSQHLKSHCRAQTGSSPPLLTASSPHARQCRKMCLTTTLCKLFGCFSAVYLNIPTMCFTADTRHYVDREWMYEMYIRVLTASKDSSSVYLINVFYLWSLSMENKTSDLKCPCLYFLISGMFSCLGYLLDYGIFLISYLLCLVK